MKGMILLEGKNMDSYRNSLAAIFFVSLYTAKETQSSRKTLLIFLQVACNKAIGWVLLHVASGKAFDCLRYDDPREKRKPSQRLYNARDFDYALSVLWEVIDTRY